MIHYDSGVILQAVRIKSYRKSTPRLELRDFDISLKFIHVLDTSFMRYKKLRLFQPDVPELQDFEIVYLHEN